MTPIINPWLFYLVNVIDNLKSACFAIILIIVISFGAITLVELGEGADELELNEAKVIKNLKKMAIAVVLLMAFDMFLPSKETCYQMMIASQITDNNIQKAEDTIKESVDYIFEKINEGK